LNRTTELSALQKPKTSQDEDCKSLVRRRFQIPRSEFRRLIIVGLFWAINATETADSSIVWRIRSCITDYTLSFSRDKRSNQRSRVPFDEWAIFNCTLFISEYSCQVRDISFLSFNSDARPSEREHFFLGFQRPNVCIRLVVLASRSFPIKIIQEQPVFSSIIEFSSLISRYASDSVHLRLRPTGNPLPRAVRAGIAIGASISWRFTPTIHSKPDSPSA
jgi:hypothetical protein